MGTDLLITFRSLGKRPGFVLVAIITLALGIGANTALFGVVNAVLLEPLPFAEPDKLVVVREEKAKEAKVDDVSALNFLDLKDNRSFSALAAWRPWGFAMTGHGEPRDMNAVRVSANLFSMLGVAPAKGRSFLPDEDRPGRDQVVILSDGFWKEAFGSSSSVLGQALTLDGKPYTIIGIMPPGFRFPDDPAIAIWVPLAFASQELTIREQRMFNVIGRLKPTVSMVMAESELDALAQGLAERYPDTNAGWSIRLTPAGEVFVGSQRPLIIL
jgi:putative ABC transport system permease protein